jgi:hypothetical protein
MWRNCGVEYLSAAGCAKIRVSCALLSVRKVTDKMLDRLWLSLLQHK